MADGHLNKCKECTRTDTKTRIEEKIKDPDFLELEQQRHREKYHRLNYREKHKPPPERQRECALLYKLRYPEKIAAKSKLGKSPIGCHYHHWSYKKEHHKDVIPLRRKDHHTLHRFIVYDQQNMCYKTKSGALLDTKEKHIKHAMHVFWLHGIEAYF